MLGINHCAVNVRENFELVGYAQVVSVTGDAVGNHPRAHLLLGVGVNHVVLLRHPADPAVTLDHGTPWKSDNWVISYQVT